MSSDQIVSAVILSLGLCLLIGNRRLTHSLVAAEVRYGTDKQRRQASDPRVFQRKRIQAALLAALFCLGGLLGLLD